MQWKLKKDSRVWKDEFSNDVSCSGSEFQRVGMATENPWVPAWVLTLGTDEQVKTRWTEFSGHGC